MRPPCLPLSLRRSTRPSTRPRTFATCPRLLGATHSGSATSPATYDEETDVLIVGSGAGALTTSLRASQLGLRSIVIEKEGFIGGASALSGGCIWIPCNPVSAAAGIKDSKDGALAYLNQAIGDAGPASSLVKREAYLTYGPRMVSFLQDEGFRFHFSKGYPDYYPEMKGSMGEGGGRTIETKAFDLRKIGDWQSKLPPSRGIPAIYANDSIFFSRLTSSLGAFLHATLRMLPLIAKWLVGQKLTSLGRGLVAQLLYLNLKRKADVRVNVCFQDLIQEPSGHVTGVIVSAAEGPRSFKATRAVVLAAGGFAHNQEMRQQYMPKPASTDWTNSPTGDTGDAIRAAMRIGAATSLLDDAWWGPTIMDPITSSPNFALMERARPHCIIVDSTGSRFMNEAQPYTDAGHDQYARNNKVKAIPAWLIMDTNHRNRYMLGSLFARQKPPKQALAEGRIFVGASLEELAAQIGVDPEGLHKTTERYNDMCREGIDKDFDKGKYAYDKFFGDSAAGGRNPNMGPLERAPYYATQIWPGDLGTKGGLLTDQHQRVLDEEHRPIPGLFAIGNTAASIMGRTYVGAGSTLGPAMVHGYIAASFLGESRSGEAECEAGLT